MKKTLLWILLIALMLSVMPCAVSEQAAEQTATVKNGRSAAKSVYGTYLAVPQGISEMLVHVTADGAHAVKLGTADSYTDFMTLGDAVVCLKTTNGSSEIISLTDNNVTSLYAFGANSVSELGYYDGTFTILMDEHLHSIAPDTGLCLKMSGAQVLDYALENNCAFFVSGGDTLSYSEPGEGENAEEVTVSGGCLYRLDLSSGETVMKLKSGVTVLEAADDCLYFRNLADHYNMDGVLYGKLYSFDTGRETLTKLVEGAEDGFWPVSGAVFTLRDGTLYMQDKQSEAVVYAPAADAVISCDDENVYVYEASLNSFIAVNAKGIQSKIYDGNLADAVTPDAVATPTPESTVEPQGTPEPVFGNLQDIAGTSGKSDFAVTAGKSTPLPINTVKPVTASAPSAASAPAGETEQGGSSSSSSSSSSATTKVSAPSSGTVLYVTGGSVNMRKGPGTSYGKITSLSKGTQVTSAGEGRKDSSGTTWYKITYKSQTGWMAAGYLSKSMPSPSGASGEVTIKDGNCYLRSAPNKSGSVLATVPEGTKLTISAKSTDSRGVDWYKTSYGGHTGWVSSVYAKKSGGGGGGGGEESASGTVTVTGGSCHLRSEADKGSASKGTVPNGTKLTITAKKKDGRGIYWYKTSYGGKTGWVSSVYAKTGGGGGGGGSSVVKISGGSCHLRQDPNKESKSLGTIPNGTEVTYLGSAKQDGRGVTWFKVSYKSKTGWVSEKYSYIK